MNLALGVFWSIPTLAFLLVGGYLARKDGKKFKVFGYISLLLGIFLLVNVFLLFIDYFEV